MSDNTLNTGKCLRKRALTIRNIFMIFVAYVTITYLTAINIGNMHAAESIGIKNIIIFSALFTCFFELVYCLSEKKFNYIYVIFTIGYFLICTFCTFTFMDMYFATLGKDLFMLEATISSILFSELVVRFVIKRSYILFPSSQDEM